MPFHVDAQLLMLTSPCKIEAIRSQESQVKLTLRPVEGSSDALAGVEFSNPVPFGGGPLEYSGLMFDVLPCIRCWPIIVSP